MLRSTLRKLLVLGLVPGLLGPAGCGRKFYRKSADEEVGHVLAEKNRNYAWAIDQYHVYPDSRARFGDPTNPDHPPKPPDDPGAFELSPNPQRPGRSGVKYIEGTGYLDLLAVWDEENRARLGRGGAGVVRGQDSEEASEEPPVGPPAPPASTPSYGPQTTEGGPLSSIDRALSLRGKRPYLITVEQAVELGLVNSREFQTRREDLYLTALPVTLERFAFASQFFATEEAVRQRTGSDALLGSTNLWSLNTTGGFTKLFPTGALLLARLANQTVVNLTGDLKHTISETQSTLDLIQPLLRGGGFAVTLEPLTQTERNLLYEVRFYARFRKQFYVFIAGGGDIGRGAQQVIGRNSLASTPGFTAPTQGYLPILLIGAQLANQRKNVAALERLLVQFRDLLEGGLVQQLQVDQVEQNLLNSRNNVLQIELNYRNSLDRLKLQLGLPPEVELELEDTPLRPLSEQFVRNEQVIRQFEEARAAVIQQEELEQGVGALASFLTINPLLPNPAAAAVAARMNAAEVSPGLFAARIRGRAFQALTASSLVEGTEFQKRIQASWPSWIKLSNDQLLERLKRLREEMRQQLLIRDQRETQNLPVSEAVLRRIADIDFEIDVGELEQLLRTYETAPWKDKQAFQERLRTYAVIYQSLVTEFFGLLARVRRERIERLSRDWPELLALRVEDVNLLATDLPEAQTVGARTALANRLDLMNARGQLVDAWRQIAVFANALLGVFNVRYHWNAFTPFGEAQPFNLGGTRQLHQLFLNVELPLVRKLERNDYRAALIGFQRQRRDLMAAEDTAIVGVREEIRQLRVFAENYRIQKRLVELAYLQVENSQEEFSAPPPPTRTTDFSSSANAAALTRQRLDAQNSLLQAQNQLYSTWINYLTTRLELYRDLELMPLDFRGVWIDELANLSSGNKERGTAPGADDRSEQLPPPRTLPPVVP